MKLHPLPFFLTLGLILCWSALSGATTRLKPGDPAADFTVIGPQGQSIRLSDYRGKVVVLDFWATWCGPCIEAMPELSALAESRKDDGLVVLSICVADTRDNYDDWVRRHGEKFAFLTAHDPVGKPLRDSMFSSTYGVSMLPAIFVVDRQGQLVGRATTYPKEKANLGELLLKAGLPEKTHERPKPGFRGYLGDIQAGDALIPVTVQTPEGHSVALCELAGSRATVLTVFRTTGLDQDSVDFLNTWGARYAEQGLQMIGLAAYGTESEFAEWLATIGNKLNFPVVFDPAGALPPPSVPKEDMSDDEIAAYNALRREHFRKVTPMQLAGGRMLPIPHTIVFDNACNFLGVYVGSGETSRQSLANLLIRAGISLEQGDLPAYVFSAEETAPPPPEAIAPQLQSGQSAPDFTAYDVNGNAVRISDYKGKVVVLDFWATWCGPCKASIPHLQEVAAAYKDQGVVVLGSSTRDKRRDFEKWIQANGEKYPDIIWAHDPAENRPERASRAAYGVSGIPTQFVIGRNGTIVDAIVGYLKGEVLLEAALAKAGIDVPNDILKQAEENRRQRNRLQ